MGLNKFSSSMFREDAYLLTALPALNACISDDLGFTRKEVIATVSGTAQHQEWQLALKIAAGLIQDYQKPVLLLTARSRMNSLEWLEATVPGSVGLADRLLQVENPRYWEDFEAELKVLIEAVQPIMILIEKPADLIPCEPGWEHVLQRRQLHDPWGGLARRVKALSESAACPIWVFGELCYAQQYPDLIYTETIPESEQNWRTCAELEAFIDYWDCVIEVKAETEAGAEPMISLSSLKNRLGSSFSNIRLTENS